MVSPFTKHNIGWIYIFFKGLGGRQAKKHFRQFHFKRKMLIFWELCKVKNKKQNIEKKKNFTKQKKNFFFMSFIALYENIFFFSQMF